MLWTEFYKCINSNHFISPLQVAPFVNLPDAVLEGFLQKYEEEQEAEIHAVQAKYVTHLLLGFFKIEENSFMRRRQKRGHTGYHVQVLETKYSFLICLMCEYNANHGLYEFYLCITFQMCTYFSCPCAIIDKDFFLLGLLS